MEKDKACLGWLQAHGIPYTLLEHAPAFTMQDIHREGVSAQGMICKNLFLRDSKKGKQHFLVVVCGDKAVDLKQLGETLGQRLSFASEKRLQKFLGLSPGSVSPLGLIFDENHEVVVLLDEAITAEKTLGFHPCVNDKTVLISYENLRKILEMLGNRVETVTI